MLISKPGLYRIYWVDNGGTSVASVSVSYNGDLLVSPCNWIDPDKTPLKEIIHWIDSVDFICDC